MNAQPRDVEFAFTFDYENRELYNSIVYGKPQPPLFIILVTTRPRIAPLLMRRRRITLALTRLGLARSWGWKAAVTDIVWTGPRR